LKFVEFTGARTMNLKAAEIAWMLAMEHNRLHKALTAICKPKDDEEYNVLKKRFFRSMYRMTVQILEAPDTANEQFKEFLSRTLDEEPRATEGL
jgi:hypothetical protein